MQVEAAGDDGRDGVDAAERAARAVGTDLRDPGVERRLQEGREFRRGHLEGWRPVVPGEGTALMPDLPGREPPAGFPSLVEERDRHAGIGEAPGTGEAGNSGPDDGSGGGGH